jgi:isopenicillin-N epimerase
MWTRRSFLRTTGTAGVAAIAAFTDEGLTRVAAANRSTAGVTPTAVASDETYWREIQQAFTLDRTIINLNNGGVSPSPRVVHEALKRYLDISNQAPVYHMWQILEPNLESVRRRLAAEFGCDVEELAITRNASEALQIAQLGIDLKPGDEVVTTNQDYGRMLDTWEQRVARDGIRLTKVSFPVPPPRWTSSPTRCSARSRPRPGSSTSATSPTSRGRSSRCGEICDEARRRGIRTVVDGAHAFAHFPLQGCRPRVRLLRHEPAQVAAGADRHRLPVRAPRAHRLALAADARLAAEASRHPQVRGDRHPSGRQPQRDCRSADLP